MLRNLPLRFAILRLCSLDTLRSHPEFNKLKHIVQNNPGAIEPKLTQIGQEPPQLLRAINENKRDFLEMMNEAVCAELDSVKTVAESFVDVKASNAKKSALGCLARKRRQRMMQTKFSGELHI
jgi:hypothetical protein